MKRSPTALWRVGDGVLVLGNPEHDDVLTVSGPGTVVWQLLEAETSLEALVPILAEQYRADPDVVRVDVAVLLDGLIAAGYVIDG